MQDLQVNSCTDKTIINSNYSKAGDVQSAMQRFSLAGAPGSVVAIYSEEGWWANTTGYAKIEDKTPMQLCHLQYLQSISKTYMAVAILKLYEEGIVDLDAPITRYLPEKYSKYITSAETITVRMLLNHTSGVPEYNFDPAYVSYLLQHPNHTFSSEDYLKYVEGKKLDFTPGSKHSYRNTNYLLLALMADAITGDHAKFISETILKPLDLDNTFYRNDPGYLKYSNLVNSYWDRYSNGIVENVSQMQQTNVASLIGDDGIVTTPTDAVKFLKGLVEGKLLAAATLQQMQTWTTDENNKPKYGLGLEYTTIRNQIAFGHTGGGLGAGCELYYFPQKKMYVFLGVNLGTVTDSPLHKGIEAARDTLYQVLLK
ncbi:beta-lactamase family protein [Adhaeribacter radiodurans]|uniref:Beta-lactamase family protein n=2 Tax=Adhaeribacter radiodurans TaxID=2745197 RepID=A0A7L7LFG8_9BACT|nr:beta-lactamase family protein [Adhaeribacter radiodurans]